MKLPRIENIGCIVILALVIIAFFYLILGFSGMMTLIGIMLLIMLPAYLILNNSELEHDEKIIFSFFLGAGIFPSITYWIGMLISFKIAIFIAFIILMIAAYLTTKFFNNKNAKSQQSG